MITLPQIIRVREIVDAVPKSAKERIGSYSDEYGKRGLVFRDADGCVYVEIHTDPRCFYPIYKFANRESFDAYRREVDYVDREHRFPGINPHAQPWQI